MEERTPLLMEMGRQWEPPMVVDDFKRISDLSIKEFNENCFRKPFTKLFFVV
jgi:hypothetical protein